jgi:hypothetical protein
MKRTEEQRLEHIIRRMQTDTAVDAPADAIGYVKNLYRSRMTAPARSVLERVMAVLRVDLAPNRAAFGERSAGDGQARQMLFDSGHNAVDLRIKATEEGFELRGQVLGTGFANGKIEVLGPQNTIQSNLTEVSQFDLKGLPAGDYSVSIKGDDKEIFIDQLVLN